MNEARQRVKASTAKVSRRQSYLDMIVKPLSRPRRSRPTWTSHELSSSAGCQNDRRHRVTDQRPTSSTYDDNELARRPWKSRVSEKLDYQLFQHVLGTLTRERFVSQLEKTLNSVIEEELKITRPIEEE